MSVARSILFVSADSIYPETVGGMEVRGRDLSRALAERAEVTVMSALERATTASATSPWFGNLSTPPMAWAKEHVSWSAVSGAEIRMARLHVRRLLDRTSPDLIYLNKIDRFAPAVLHELVAAGLPLVGYFGDRHQGYALKSILDGTWFDSLHPRIRALGGLAPLSRDTRDRLFCVFNCEFLRAHYDGALCSSDRQAVIYEGLDIHAFAPPPLPVKQAHFAFVGRATSQKGFLDFCQALAALPPDLVQSIDIVGDGPALAEGLAILREVGHGGAIVGAGPCRREDLADRLRTRSILLLPSYDEGLPRVVVEAMAAGVCAVASNVGGVPELIRDGETGFMHRPGDVRGLVAQARRVAASFELRQKLSARARALIVERHERTAWLTRTLDVVFNHPAAMTAAGPASALSYSR